MVHKIRDVVPRIADGVFIAWNAEVAGDVRIGERSSVWFGAVLRGDIAGIVVGKETNVQEGSVLHVDSGEPCVVGDRVTVGHMAILHSCTIGDGALIGMGAVILNGASIGEECLVGAGALVTQGKSFPPRSLILGSPAKTVRELRAEELESLRQNAGHYVELARSASTEYAPVNS
jgi:carbonic anhydrase/acetyltransferase-like protein (isoleucine patch superfamily)